MPRLAAVLAIVLAVSPSAPRVEASPRIAAGRAEATSVVEPPSLGVPIPVKCAVLKRKAAGKALLATLKCHAKGKVPGMHVSSDCLQMATRKLALALHKYPGACAGEPDAIDDLIATCADVLMADDPGTDACAVKAAIGLGKGGNGRLVCAAKDIQKPGTMEGCYDDVGEKLVKALTKSGTCVAPSTLDDLHACTASLIDALPVPPTP